ncbi:MAG: hypothetical protein LBQ06_01025, partial [Frankiaceae bacterium]|nr:hypothetical protein [Frankiaceae bacterium]
MASPTIPSPDGAGAARGAGHRRSAKRWKASRSTRRATVAVGILSMVLTAFAMVMWGSSGAGANTASPYRAHGLYYTGGLGAWWGGYAKLPGLDPAKAWYCSTPGGGEANSSSARSAYALSGGSFQSAGNYLSTAQLSYALAKYGNDSNNNAAAIYKLVEEEVNHEAYGSLNLTPAATTALTAIVADARRNGGPYAVAMSALVQSSTTASAGAAIGVAGAHYTATVTVTGPGGPVAGVGATLNASGGVRLDSATVVTDQNGSAQFGYTAPGSAGEFAITASVTEAATLVEAISTVQTPRLSQSVMSWSLATRTASQSGAVVTPAPALNVQTQASAQVALTGQPLSDTVVISGNDSSSGTIHATLYGPVTPAAGASDCSGITLAQWQAAPAQTVSAPFSGNGTFVVRGPAVQAAGCYGWAETATVTPSGASASSPPTAPNESTLVTKPALETRASAQTAAPGDQITDTVVVTGAAGVAGTITGSLLGPLAPSGGSCAGLDWSTAPTASKIGPIAITGSGTYVTSPITITATGCFTFQETATFGSASAAGGAAPVVVTSVAGIPSETVLSANASPLVGPTQPIAPPTTPPPAAPTSAPAPAPTTPAPSPTPSATSNTPAELTTSQPVAPATTPAPTPEA